MFLELRNLNIGYQQPLIQDINAQAHLGEVVLIMGNNGIGKTTLIKSILNQLKPLAGQIFINHSAIATLAPKEMAQLVSIVFSKYTLPENYTVTDLVALGKLIHYPYYFQLTSQDQAEIQNIITHLGLERYKNQKLTTLSDGNLQKAFIGRALAQNTPVMILDEPTTHLDEYNKTAILTLLRELAQQHRKLVLFSSHDWRLAKDFSDQIWFLEHGKLTAGMAEDVLLKLPLHTPLAETYAMPLINAPEREKELLLSFIKKHTKANLSCYEFTYTSTEWLITTPLATHRCGSFAEMLPLFKA
ncbi:ABC transporter ATP-binding protein [Riemerella anatipestifer]|uniref:ABC transporter ATP-binding protein n=1 Tax=Riemerella anatipestifer TaxID=34085 RepID=UPI001374F9BF|nr:ABC transporter ATP-binding protein [Riemerella anatipestifer]